MDYQSLLLLADSDRSPAYQDRVGHIEADVLRAQEERLKAKLPPQFRAFLEVAGSGEFRFGKVFSPIVEDGSSELDDEWREYQDAEDSWQLRLLRRLEPAGLATAHLLPFARKRGWLFLFNLDDHSAPDTVWSWDSDAEGDESTPAGQVFADWLAAQYEPELAGLAALEETLKAVAAEENRLVEFFYQDKGESQVEPQSRTVRPLKLWVDKEGEQLLFAYQVEGWPRPHDPSKPDHPNTFRPARITGLKVLDELWKPTAEQQREIEAWLVRFGAAAAI